MIARFAMAQQKNEGVGFEGCVGCGLWFCGGNGCENLG
jgi:hypothetical protein